MYRVYKYTNKHNGKVYIGQTKNSLSERAQSNGLNYIECRRFYNAIQKYGWDSFEPCILADNLSLDESNFLEEYYISLYESTNPNNGYNIDRGGMNHHMSNETKKIISELAKDRYKDKTKNPMYGRKHSECAIQKMSDRKKGSNNPMYGSIWNENQRMRCCNKGKKLNLTHERIESLREHGRFLGNLRRKPVRCIEDDIVFQSSADASEYYGIKPCSLCDHLKGRTHTCCNRHFEYVI